MFLDSGPKMYRTYRIINENESQYVLETIKDDMTQVNYWPEKQFIRGVCFVLPLAHNRSPQYVTFVTTKRNLCALTSAVTRMDW